MLHQLPRLARLLQHSSWDWTTVPSLARYVQRCIIIPHHYTPSLLNEIYNHPFPFPPPFFFHVLRHLTMSPIKTQNKNKKREYVHLLRPGITSRKKNNRREKIRPYPTSCQRLHRKRRGAHPEIASSSPLRVHSCKPPRYPSLVHQLRIK